MPQEAASDNYYSKDDNNSKDNNSSKDDESCPHNSWYHQKEVGHACCGNSDLPNAISARKKNDRTHNKKTVISGNNNDEHDRWKDYPGSSADNYQAETRVREENGIRQQCSAPRGRC